VSLVVPKPARSTQPVGERELSSGDAGSAVVPIGLASQTIASPPRRARRASADRIRGQCHCDIGLAVVFSPLRRAPASARSPDRPFLVGAGRASSTPTQPGDATHQAAPQCKQSFTVGGGPPVRACNRQLHVDGARRRGSGGPAYHRYCNASSGLAVALSATSRAAGVCTLSGSTLRSSARHMHDRRQPVRERSYQPAPQVQQVVRGSARDADDRLQPRRAPARSPGRPGYTVAPPRARPDGCVLAVGG